MTSSDDERPRGEVSVYVDQELLTRAKGAVMLNEGREVTDDAVIGKALQALVVVWEKYQETADDEDGERDRIKCLGTKTDGGSCHQLTDHISGYCTPHRDQWDGETPDDRHDPESENDQTEEENQETPKTDEKTVQEQNEEQ